MRRAAARARKADLLAEAARNFCGIARPTHHDTTVFRELFYQLVDGSDKAERRALAASLARNVYTPRTILLYLALDDYDIAAPVLLFSEALGENDIKNLAVRVSQQSLEILCRRTNLTVNAARSLIAAGGTRCRDIIAKNPALKDDSGIQALLAGLEPVEVEEVLVETRADHLAAVTETAPAEKKQVAQEQTIREKPAQEPVGQEPAVAALAAESAGAAPRSSLQQELSNLAARGGRLGREARSPGHPSEPGFDPAKPIEQQLVRAARAGDRRVLASYIEAWCGLPAATCAAILEKGGARELIVLFKGLGLSDLGTVQCLLQLDAQIARNISAYNEAKAILSSIDTKACRAFIESLGAHVTRPANRREEPRPQEAQMEIDVSALRAIASQRRREILASVGQTPADKPPLLFQSLKSA
jgi:uncharacterized protein (DUF2336 family)